MEPSSFEEKVIHQGKEIFELMESTEKSIFSKDFWYSHIMDWSMKNEKFRVQMFRFIDVLPSLKSNKDVALHLKEYFTEEDNELPSIFNAGIGLGSLAPGIMAGIVKKNITEMSKLFITGESPEKTHPVLVNGRKKSLCFTIDLLGEATLSESEAEVYQNRYIELISWLSKKQEDWPHHKILDEDERGPIPKLNVSVKTTSLYSQINECSWEESKKNIKKKLRPIFTLSKNNFVFLNLDMESYKHKNMTLEIFKELVLETEFKDYPHWGIVIQAYLKDSFKDLEDLVAFSKSRSQPITIRLVKGAYWDYETIYADQQNWPNPVYTIKEECDANYEACTKLLLENYPYIRTAIASHNVRSISYAMVLANELKMDKRAIEFQMLYGMADEIKAAIVKKKYRLRQYATVGELIPSMAYLVRRLLENTSNTSFLRSKFAENTEVHKLLKNPKEISGKDLAPKIKKQFINEPLLDFNHQEPRDRMMKAINECKNKKIECSPIIDGKSISTEKTLKSLNPNNPNHELGHFYLAQISHAQTAVESAKKAFLSWKKVPTQKRIQYLNDLAELIKKNRYELSALEILEVGKTWTEADGDITEAIDFCRYYAQNMKEISQSLQIGQTKGEVTHYEYQPRGVCLVIAPWNFPLAILTGMVVAGLVTGNTVIIKPAEESTLVAYELMKMLTAVGIPESVVQFLPGKGEIVGNYLVEHKDIDIINFTGSKKVGLGILEKAAKVKTHQVNLKRCIVEMGGKNSIIIDSDADLDEAVSGVIHSTFAFQGQKCSASSRVITLKENHSLFLERLVEAAKSLPVGFTENPYSKIGPVISEEAQKIILEKIEKAKSYATVAFQGTTPQTGYFVSPTIFSDVTNDMEIAQFELFGPVLAVIKAQDLNHALAIANDTEYGLTGGVYSRSPLNIEKVKQELNVGNLYINRPITGAMVNRHPFGGFKMSGAGSKAGGPDYLKQFMEPRCITENTMRRGFAPDS